MNNLIRVIGLAPSELSFEKLLIRIRTERTRVLETIQRFRTSRNVKPTKRKAKAPLKSAAQLEAEILVLKEMEKLGISLEDLEQMKRSL